MLSQDHRSINRSRPRLLSFVHVLVNNLVDVAFYESDGSVPSNFNASYVYACSIPISFAQRSFGERPRDPCYDVDKGCQHNECYDCTQDDHVMNKASVGL